MCWGNLLHISVKRRPSARPRPSAYQSDGPHGVPGTVLQTLVHSTGEGERALADQHQGWSHSVVKYHRITARKRIENVPNGWGIWRRGKMVGNSKIVLSV